MEKNDPVTYTVSQINQDTGYNRAYVQGGTQKVEHVHALRRWSNRTDSVGNDCLDHTTVKGGHVEHF